MLFIAKNIVCLRLHLKEVEGTNYITVITIYYYQVVYGKQL